MASAYDVEGGRGTDRLCLEPDSLVYSGAVGGASNSSDGQNQPSRDVQGPPRLPASPCEKRSCRNHILCRKHRAQILEWDSKLLFSLWYHVRLFVTPWTEARQVSLSVAISWRLLELMSVESVMLFNHLLPPSPFALDLSQHQGLFQWVHSLHHVVKVLELTDSTYVSYFGRV